MDVQRAASPAGKELYKTSLAHVVQNQEGGHKADADASQHRFMHDPAGVGAYGTSDGDLRRLGAI